MPKRKHDKELTLKEYVFCREYLIDGNASASAKRAGYEEASAGVQAGTLMTRPAVQKEIQRLMDQRSMRLQVRGDDVLQELAKIAGADMGKMFDDQDRLLPMSEIPEDTRRCLSSYSVSEDGKGKTTVKWAFCDKVAATKLLMQNLKLLTEKHEITGKDGEALLQPIEDVRKALMDKLEKVREAVVGEAKKKD